MRIESNRPALPSLARRDGKPSSAQGADFASTITGDPAASAPAAARPLGAVEGLFALQELPDALAERRRAVLRGDQLLDRLEELRLGVLTGTLSRAQLAELTRLAAGRSATLEDPRLIQILDEIDLRAQVELAKFAAIS